MTVAAFGCLVSDLPLWNHPASTALKQTTDTAYHIASAATFLLRLAVSSPASEAQSALAEASRVIHSLRRFRDEDGWDLGDICLTQCEGLLTWIRGQQLSANLSPCVQPTQVSSSSAGLAYCEVEGEEREKEEEAGGSSRFSHNPIEGYPFDADLPWDLDDLFPDLWDTFDEGETFF